MNDFLLIASVFLLVVCIFCLLLWYWVHEVNKKKHAQLERFVQNPILSPEPSHTWESEAVFNPGVVVHDGKVHMFYRAMGGDGISRIGYAWSTDGIHFQRLDYPVYDPGPGFTLKKPSQRTLSYNTDLYASGGGWGGSEDPRAVIIEGRTYVSFSAFAGWQSIRLAITSISLGELSNKEWNWRDLIYMSPQNQTHKNWVMFPEKINGKFAILHALTPKVSIEYIDFLEELRHKPIQSNNRRSGRPGAWDAFVRGAGAPPVKTDEGWLLFYHGMDPAHPAVGYRVGAMLLKLDDPSVVLYRTEEPILSPDMWYENDWKPGVVYASGAVVLGDELIVYYGGGDKYIAAAKVNLKDFLHQLKTHKDITLNRVA